MDNRQDFDALDLHKMDLSRRYEKDSSPADGIPWRSHMQLLLIVVTIMTFLIWAAFARLEEVTRGEGKVIPSGEIQAIQILDGGIIDDILITEGAKVEKGEALLRMHNVEAASAFSAAREQYSGLVAAVTRLEAEATGTALKFPEEVISDTPESVRAEQGAYQANKEQLEGQLAVLTAQKNQKEQELTELSRRIADTTNVLDLAKKERDMVTPMVKQGASSRMELLQLDRQIAGMTAELNGLTLSYPRAEAAIRETEERINETVQGARARAQQELTLKTVEMNTLQKTLVAYQDRSDRTEIKSPVLGVVKDIRVTTIGGVVKPGETIMEIVPLEGHMIIEGHVRPSDIAFIHPGQRAVVRLSAFDFSIYGALEGKVVDISADSITNENGDSFYRVRVRTDESAISKDGTEHPIIPGMQATIDIITGDKTVMEYLLKPFIRGAETALRER